MWIFRRLWHTFIEKCRRLKGRCQRFIRGWADEDSWDISDWFIESLLSMLKKFKEDNNGHPFELTEEEWDNTIDDMIYYLGGMTEEGAANQLFGETENLTIDKDKEIISHMAHSKEKFFELFVPHFYDLWW